MRNLGSLLLLLGIGAIALNFMGMQFRILSWIDNWGMEAGWGIRAALIVVGAILFFVGIRSKEDDSSQPESAEGEPTATGSTASE